MSKAIETIAAITATAETVQRMLADSFAATTDTDEQVYAKAEALTLAKEAKITAAGVREAIEAGIRTVSGTAKVPSSGTLSNLRKAYALIGAAGIEPKGEFTLVAGAYALANSPVTAPEAEAIMATIAALPAGKRKASATEAIASAIVESKEKKKTKTKTNAGDGESEGEADTVTLEPVARFTHFAESAAALSPEHLGRVDADTLAAAWSAAEAVLAMLAGESERRAASAIFEAAEAEAVAA